jgi:hypothetical protein
MKLSVIPRLDRGIQGKGTGLRACPVLVKGVKPDNDKALILQKDTSEHRYCLKIVIEDISNHGTRAKQVEYARKKE